MQISAINSISNTNIKKSKNNTNHHTLLLKQTSFEGNTNGSKFIKFITKKTHSFVKLISKPKPEELLKTYTKEEDLGKAFLTAYKAVKNKERYIISLDKFSPEMQKNLQRLKGETTGFNVFITKKGKYSCRFEGDNIEIGRLKTIF